MKYKKDINWLIVNVFRNTKITFKDLNPIERYFLRKIQRKFSKIKTEKNTKKLRGQKFDVVICDEMAKIDWDSIKDIKPKDL